MRRSLRFLIPLLAIVAIIGAACTSGSDDDDGTGDTPPAVPTNGGDAPAPIDDGVTPAASIADGWSATTVGAGIKPALALDSAGAPSIAYLFEAIGEGFVAFASATDGWTLDTVVEGYFYGPIDLAFDPEGRPNIVYHDHQASSFQQDLGDLTYALRDGTGWQISVAEDDGHDGWDSTIAIAADGVVRAAGVDPSQFGSSDGIEYYELSDGVWSVTAIGSGPIEYEFNVGLAVGPDGLPALSYYNDRDGELVFASFDGSAWTLETVTADGDVGKFSSLQFDAEGRPHISFFEDLGGSSGRILYAVRDGGAWTVEEVGTLDDVQQGMTGTRRNSSLALDAGGVPHVVFSDEGVIRYATRTEAGWDVQEIVTAGDRPLGQLVSLKLDAAGTPHLAFFEVTSGGPLDGLVVYVTQG